MRPLTWFNVWVVIILDFIFGFAVVDLRPTPILRKGPIMRQPCY